MNKYIIDFFDLFQHKWDAMFPAPAPSEISRLAEFRATTKLPLASDKIISKSLIASYIHILDKDLPQKLRQQIAVHKERR